MRETGFIQQNKDKWEAFEKTLSQEKKDPDKLSNLFIQLTDDLSYSRTFYPNRSIRVYLNNLAQQVFYSVYKSKKGKRKRIVHFWKEELPQLVYESRRELTLSFALFVISMLIGIFSSINDPEFSSHILGKGYVEMTKENIKSGDPMAVYKSSRRIDMMIGITLNNLFVSVLTFVFGVILSIGSIVILVSNGIMVGTFQYFFWENGYFLDSLLTIWLHGTLEISSIIIAGAAGITLGKGLVFPGTLSRLQAFQISAKRGLKLLVGIFPIIVTAALIESFITRHTEVPAWLKIALIGLSFFFMVGYFIWLPLRKAKRGVFSTFNVFKIQPSRPAVLDYSQVRTNSEIFKDIFLFYKKYAGKLIPFLLLLSIIQAVPVVFLLDGMMPVYFNFRGWFFVSNLFAYDANFLLYAINTLGFSAGACRVYHFMSKDSGSVYSASGKLLNFLYCFLASATLNLVFFINGWLSLLLIFVFVPFLLLFLFIQVKEIKNPVSTLSRMFSLAGAAFLKFYGLFLVLAFLSFLYYLLIDSWMLAYYFEFFSYGFNLTFPQLRIFFISFATLACYSWIHLIIPVSLVGYGLLWSSLKEISEASVLKEKISSIGLKK